MFTGVYLGDKCIGSFYDDVKDEFDNHEFSFSEDDMVTETGSIYTSLRDLQVKGQTVSENMALAYRSFCELNRLGKKARRVYSIDCKGEEVSLFSAVDFEKEASIEYSHSQKMMDSGEYDEVILDYLALTVEEESYSNIELREATRIIDEYRMEITEAEKKEVATQYRCISDFFIDLKEDKENIQVHFESMDLDLTKSRINQYVQEQMAQEYISEIGSLIHDLSANFSKDDVVFIYTDIHSFGKRFEDELHKISEKNHVSIKTINDSRMNAIAEGNAYHYYLLNKEYVKRVKDNIGRYSICYESQEDCLAHENGRVTKVICNDFETAPSFIIIDCAKGTKNRIEFELPFFMSGDSVVIEYKYSVSGITLTMIWSSVKI